MKGHCIHGRHWNVAFPVCKDRDRCYLLSVFGHTAGVVGGPVAVNDVAVSARRQTGLDPAVSFWAECSRIASRSTVDQNESQRSAAESDSAITVTPPIRDTIPVGIDRVTKSDHICDRPPSMFAHPRGAAIKTCVTQVAASVDPNPASRPGSRFAVIRRL